MEDAGIEKLQKLFAEASRRIRAEDYKKWLAYCLGIMSYKMDKLDMETMKDGIKKYEV